MVCNYPSTIGKFLIKNSPKVEGSSGVYYITCNDCSEVYIGETGHSVHQRQLEHKRSVRNGDTNNALFVHVSENNHTINWNNVQLFYKENSLKKRKIIESAVINATPTMNLSDGCYKLDNVITSHVLKAANLTSIVKRLNSFGVT